MYGWRFRRRWNGIGAVVSGAAKEAEPGSEEEFITEHYWGYSSLRGGGCVEYRVEHPRWRVWPLLRPVLDCDVAGLYGPRFAGASGGRAGLGLSGGRLGGGGVSGAAGGVRNKGSEGQQGLQGTKTAVPDVPLVSCLRRRHLRRRSVPRISSSGLSRP